MKLSQEIIEKEASYIKGFLQDAVADTAFSGLHFIEGEIGRKRDRLLEEGKAVHIVQDIIADDLYDDVETLRDMAGDRIFDAVQPYCSKAGKPEYKETKEAAIQLAKEIKKGGHDSLVQAMDAFIKYHTT